jgi:hypothetical protein
MPNRALSEHVKATKRAKIKEEKLQKAIKAYAQEQAKPPKLWQGVHAIAMQFLAFQSNIGPLQTATREAGAEEKHVKAYRSSPVPNRQSWSISLKNHPTEGFHRQSEILVSMQTCYYQNGWGPTQVKWAKTGCLTFLISIDAL